MISHVGTSFQNYIGCCNHWLFLLSSSKRDLKREKKRVGGDGKREIWNYNAKSHVVQFFRSSCQVDRFNHPLRLTGGTGEGTGYSPSHCRDATHLLLSLFPFIPGAASSRESFQHTSTMHPLTNQVLEAFFDLVIRQILVTALTLGIFAAQKVTT